MNWINKYSGHCGKIAGVLFSIVAVSGLFISSYQANSRFKWLGILISVIAAMFGAITSLWVLELKSELTVQQTDGDAIQLDSFDKKLQKYKTKIIEKSSTKIIYSIPYRERQFYYHLTKNILEGTEMENKINIEIS